jgi:hypothetical protein
MAPRSYNLPKLDAAENIFFARELEQIRAKSYDIKYAQRKIRTLVPVDNSVDPGAEVVTYSQYDRVGVAKLIASYAEDLPRADVKGKQFSVTVKGMGSSYGYSVQEIRSARLAGKPLDSRKADAARQAIEDKIDSIGAVGDTATGLVGLLNIASAQTYTITAGAGTQTKWNFGATPKTGLEVIKDMNSAVHTVVTVTKEAEKPDTLLLPVAQYAYIASTPLQSGSDTTILQFFLRNSPYIKAVEPWEKLAGAGSGATDRMMAYRRDPDALMLVIPQEFEQFPPDQEGLNSVIACHARIAGVQCFYPLSVIYADGV